jgi:hypothetical protein
VGFILRYSFTWLHDPYKAMLKAEHGEHHARCALCSAALLARRPWHAGPAPHTRIAPPAVGRVKEKAEATAKHLDASRDRIRALQAKLAESSQEAHCGTQSGGVPPAGTKAVWGGGATAQKTTPKQLSGGGSWLQRRRQRRDSRSDSSDSGDEGDQAAGTAWGGRASRRCNFLDDDDSASESDDDENAFHHASSFESITGAPYSQPMQQQMNACMHAARMT